MPEQQSRPGVGSQAAAEAFGGADPSVAGRAWRHVAPGRRPALIVDGARPSVAWVTSLPHTWTTTPERLALLTLACDAFDDQSSPGGDALVGWIGLSRQRVYEVLGALAEDRSPRRPALIERLVKGRTLRPDERNPGRTATTYRLRTEIQPLGNSYGSTSGEPYEPSDGWLAQPSGEPSGEPLEISDTPFPSLPTSSSVGLLRTERASEQRDDDGGRDPWAIGADR